MTAQSLLKKVHPAWGISIASVGLLIGLAAAHLVHAPSNTIVFWTLVIVLGSLFIRLRVLTCAIVCIISITIGIIHGSEIKRQLNLTNDLAGQTLTIQGAIAEDPQISARGDQRIIVSQLNKKNRTYRGSIWVSGAKGDYKRGDKVILTGEVKEGFATYQLVMYRPEITLAKKQHDPIIGFRDKFAVALRWNVVEPAASLGIGFVIGQKSALPPELEEQLRIVGLTHLVVASGYNLTILIRFAKRLFEKHSKFLVNASSISTVTMFVMISGASPSMVRASIVSGLSLLVWNYGRTIHPIILIVFVAALTAMIEPNYLWADVGWWLSFLAFFGVLVVSPLWLELLSRLRQTEGRRASPISQLISETCAAQIMTLPISLYIFGALPVTALIANIITAPLIPAAMAVTAIAGLGSMIIPQVSVLISLPATIVLSYFVAVVRYLAGVPWAIQEISMSIYIMVGLYIALIIFTFIMWRKLKYNFRRQSLID